MTDLEKTGEARRRGIAAIAKGYSLVSAGLLYLDAATASLEALHGKEAIAALQVANTSVTALQALLDRLRALQARTVA